MFQILTDIYVIKKKGATSYKLHLAQLLLVASEIKGSLWTLGCGEPTKTFSSRNW